MEKCTYFELYAGGAGAALELLFSKSVNRIVLNDADYHIYSFWKSILNQTEDFIYLIYDTEINLDTWHLQRHIYENFNDFSVLEVGFSTFFLNRSNRSGILTKAGPIGGFKQEGNYKIDARFNKPNLIERIKKISNTRDQIEIYNRDTIDFISSNLNRFNSESIFMYLDPPYYNKGRSLYLNYYDPEDHARLRNLLKEIRHLNWIVSYDDVPQIKELYRDFKTSKIELNYSLQKRRKATEFCIYSDNIKLNNKPS